MQSSFNLTTLNTNQMNTLEDYLQENPILHTPDITLLDQFDPQLFYLSTSPLEEEKMFNQNQFNSSINLNNSNSMTLMNESNNAYLLNNNNNNGNSQAMNMDGQQHLQQQQHQQMFQIVQGNGYSNSNNSNNLYEMAASPYNNSYGMMMQQQQQQQVQMVPVSCATSSSLSMMDQDNQCMLASQVVNFNSPTAAAQFRHRGSMDSVVSNGNSSDSLLSGYDMQAVSPDEVCGSFTITTDVTSAAATSTTTMAPAAASSSTLNSSDATDGMINLDDYIDTPTLFGPDPSTMFTSTVPGGGQPFSPASISSQDSSIGDNKVFAEMTSVRAHPHYRTSSFSSNASSSSSIPSQHEIYLSIKQEAEQGEQASNMFQSNPTLQYQTPMQTAASFVACEQMIPDTIIASAIKQETDGESLQQQQHHQHQQQKPSILLSQPCAKKSGPATARKRQSASASARTTSSSSSSSSAHTSSAGGNGGGGGVTKKQRMTKREKQQMMEGQIAHYTKDNKELADTIDLLMRKIDVCKKFLKTNVTPLIARQQNGPQSQQQQQQPMLILSQ